MNKSYSVNGVVYDFTDVHMECGMLYGRCTTSPHRGKWAWLDLCGIQFEGVGNRRMQATEVVHRPTICDNSYTMWGGELRDKLPHGARYYQNPRAYRK